MTRTQATLATTFALALSVFAVAGHANAETPPMDGYRGTTFAEQRPMPSHEVEQYTASGNQVNGRPDWDVDYPSQLAPQALHASRTGTALGTPTPITEPR